MQPMEKFAFVVCKQNVSTEGTLESVWHMKKQLQYANIGHATIMIKT